MTTPAPSGAKHVGRQPPRRLRDRSRRGKPGSTPGTLIAPPGPERDVLVRVARYTPESLVEEVLTAPRGDGLPSPGPGIEWVDVTGLQDLELLRELGSRFGLHRLTLEDVLTGVGVARTEAYQGYLFVVMPRLSLQDGRFRTDQLSVVMTAESVLSLHQTEGDPLAPVRDRLRNPHGHLRNSGPDYLAYALVDSVVDEYYPHLADFDDVLDALEEQVVAAPEPSQLLQIRHLKDDLQILRRAVWSMREVAAQLVRDETRSFTEETRVYLRNVYAHTVELLELVEIYRETVFGLTDLYLATQGHRMNEIMKVLTLVATIFIPLTFVVGIYGMNFEFMPELHSRMGYPVVLIGMAVLAVLMLVYFRRRKWL